MITIKNIRHVLLGVLLLPATTLATDDAWTRSYSLETDGQYNEAAKTIEKFLKNIPDNEFAELRSGWLYYLAGNYSRSIKHYQTALKLNQQSLEARLGLSLPLMAQGRWQEAAVQNNDVIKLSKWNYHAHVRLMACEEALKQWSELTAHAEAVRHRYPANATVLVYLARAYQQTGKTSQAKQVYREVLVRVPDHIEASGFLSR